MAEFAESIKRKRVSENHVLFTDPSSLGIKTPNFKDGYYTGSGDVDDVACIIYMSQQLNEQLTVVICDDDKEGNRHISFIVHLGELLMSKYNIKVIREVDFSSKIVPDGTSIYIHAPINDSTADVLTRSIANITSIFTQGNDSATNFKNATNAKQFLAAAAKAGISLIRFDTKETNFKIPYKSDFENSLTNPVLKKVYSDYFLFEKRKRFGTALHLGHLCNRLYSNTGGDEGGPGNNIKEYIVLIQELKAEGKLPELSGKLLTAFEETVGHGECDESAIQNGKDLISLMNLYCDYDELIVGGKFTKYGNLKRGEIVRRTDVDSRVAAAFDVVSYSTPLFDFAAAYFALEERKPEAFLITQVEQSLTDLNEMLGGRRRRRKSRKKTKNKKKTNHKRRTSKKRTSKKGGN